MQASIEKTCDEIKETIGSLDRRLTEMESKQQELLLSSALETSAISDNGRVRRSPPELQVWTHALY